MHLNLQKTLRKDQVRKLRLSKLANCKNIVLKPSYLPCVGFKFHFLTSWYVVSLIQKTDGNGAIIWIIEKLLRDI